jgi:hypothetical protein
LWEIEIKISNQITYFKAMVRPISLLLIFYFEKRMVFPKTNSDH